jgi:DNA-binding NarL/FixJ family response regulator
MESSKKLEVAILADNPLFAEMLKKTIVQGIEEKVMVDTLNSTSTFFKELESNYISPDVIVLDYELHKKEGEELGCKSVIDHIKRVSPETPIVVISTGENMPEAARALEYGANEYVTKDKFAFSHITNAVKDCLNPSQS